MATAADLGLCLDWAVVLRIVRNGMGVARTARGPAEGAVWAYC